MESTARLPVAAPADQAAGQRASAGGGHSVVASCSQGRRLLTGSRGAAGGGHSAVASCSQGRRLLTGSRGAAGGGHSAVASCSRAADRDPAVKVRCGEALPFLGVCPPVSQVGRQCPARKQVYLFCGRRRQAWWMAGTRGRSAMPLGGRELGRGTVPTPVRAAWQSGASQCCTLSCWGWDPS